MKELVFYLIFFSPSSGYGSVPTYLGEYTTEKACYAARDKIVTTGDVEWTRKRFTCVERGIK